MWEGNLGLKEMRDIIELDFGPTPNLLKEEYLDMNETLQGSMKTHI